MTATRPDPAQRAAQLRREIQRHEQLYYGAGRPEISDRAFDRMMANVPEEITQTFSDQQLVALSLASIPRVSPHVIDYRVSIPFFGKRYYLTVLAGRERRSRARLAREGQLMSGQVARLDATVLGVALAFGLIALAFGLYIVKSALGIDLFEGDSAMHEVFRQLNVQPPL